MSDQQQQEDDDPRWLEILFTLVSLMVPLSIGLGVGASSTIQDFKLAGKKPIPVAIGMLSQFCVMPCIALALLKIFNVDVAVAVGVALVGSAPGGSASNLFTFFAQGDLALSVTMSLLSTLAAFFMMPLWSYLLITLAMDSEERIEIPMRDIALVLLGIVIPTGIGLLVRHYNTHYKLGEKFLWERLAQFASIAGFCALLGAVIMGLIMNHDMFLSMQPTVILMAALMHPTGTIFGFCMARLVCRRSREETVAISLETGIQNFPLAMAIVNLSSFGEEGLQFPIAYGFCGLWWSVFFTSVYRFGWKKAETATTTDMDASKQQQQQDAEEGAVDQEQQPDTEEQDTYTDEEQGVETTLDEATAATKQGDKQVLDSTTETTLGTTVSMGGSTTTSQQQPQPTVPDFSAAMSV